MTNFHSPLNFTSSDLEKAALDRFRELMENLPKECRVFRSMWGSSTILCLDFVDCPDLLETSQSQSFLLLLAANSLGLSSSILFRIGGKVVSWKNL